MRRFFVGLAITAMLGMIPSQGRADDRQISQSIVKGLQAEQKNENLRGFDIDLEVDDGDVYLRGTVSSTEQEELAVDIARRVEGVRQVINELEIKEMKPTRESSSDESSDNESSREPSRTESRTITKAPSVLSSLKKVSTPVSRHIEAEEVSLEESPAIDSTDQSRELANQIIARLKREKSAGRLQGFSIDVEVENGVAWLNGKVANAEQQTRVLESVRRVPGVKQVVNGLSITQPTRTPSEVAQQIVSVLRDKKARGEIKDFSVDVEVDNGIVWLTGYAASPSQQQIILDAARYVPGVTKVVNDMTIGGPSRTRNMQVAAQTEIESSRTPVVPRPLPLRDAAVGSEIAGSRPAPGANRSGQPSLQYVWVPAGASPAATAAQTPLAFAPARSASYLNATGQSGDPVPMNASVPGMGIAPARFDHPQLPQYAWPSYSPYPNYGSITYPKQYSPMAWPYIGPFYPYPQVPLGWRKVELKWKDGWWQLDFKDQYHH